VQIAVPLQAHQPYGQRMYFPIWQAAAAARLPVAIHVDGGASVDFHPTPAGPIRYALEYNTLLPLNVGYHLASFIAEGVLERLSDLRLVFADGGISALTPIIWRLDKDWRSTRSEIPWTKRFPSDYIAEHVSFCLHQADLPLEPAAPDEWWAIADAQRLLLYSSNYPSRDFLAPSAAVAGLGDTARHRILFENARDLYHLQPAGALERAR
jgi:predicted TIM-barrel fold metal-dependent hydrolase